MIRPIEREDIPALAALEHGLFRVGGTPQYGVPEGLTLYTARSAADEAEQLLRDAARKSWRRTEDKWEDVHPSEIPIGRGWGCNPDA